MRYDHSTWILSLKYWCFKYSANKNMESRNESKIFHAIKEISSMLVIFKHFFFWIPKCNQIDPKSLWKNKKAGYHEGPNSRYFHISLSINSIKKILEESYKMHIWRLKKIIFVGHRAEVSASTDSLSLPPSPILTIIFWKNENLHKNHHIFAIGLKKNKKFVFRKTY